MSNKGFTLLESLLVLSILAVLLVAFPFVKQNTAISLHYQVQSLQYKLLSAQQKAIHEKRDVFVDFLGNEVRIDNTSIHLANATFCNANKIHFTPLGNVSSAMSITCKQGYKQKQIVVQLGTGRMYVK